MSVCHIAMALFIVVTWASVAVVQGTVKVTQMLVHMSCLNDNADAGFALRGAAICTNRHSKSVEIK